VKWRDYLTPEEEQRLIEIEHEKRAGQAEQRRIYDRCRKRVGRDNPDQHRNFTADQNRKGQLSD
jgi:hypothetical protein